MSAEDIAKLIQRVAERDREAFDELYSRTSSKLMGVALRIIKDRAEAEEALQEIFVKVWRGADRYHPTENSAMSWMIAIARHHAIDKLRARRAHEAMKSAQAGEETAAVSLMKPVPTPEEEAIRSSERERIERGLAELDPRHAQLVRGAYLEGKSYQELADQIGAPVNTVRTWLRRSLRRLREHLDE